MRIGVMDYAITIESSPDDIEYMSTEKCIMPVSTAASGSPGLRMSISEAMMMEVRCSPLKEHISKAE